MLARIVMMLALALTSLAAVAEEIEDTDRLISRDLGADHFVAGSTIRIDRSISGDLLAAGGEVEINGPVGGDAVIAGGKLRLAGDVLQDAYIAGGQLDLRGSVGRNARLAGGQIESDRDFKIMGNASVTGGDVKLRGDVGGYLQVAGGRVMLDGKVDGDVVATAGALQVGPNARIAGKLRYASRKNIKLDPAAQILGGIEKTALPAAMRHVERRDHDWERAGRAAALIWTVGLMLLAAVLIATLPRLTARIADVARTRVGMTLLMGFILLVCVPAAVLFLIVTIIGIPLALLTLWLYLVLLLVGFTVGCIAIAEWLLSRFKPQSAGRTGLRIAVAVLAVLLVTLLTRIPVLGGVLGFLLLLWGIGAIGLQVVRRPAVAPL